MCATPQMPENNNDDTDPSISSSDTSNDTAEKKPEKALSPLAMAAADWLEEEEDELAMYWDRFDAAKSNKSAKSESSVDIEENQRRIQGSTFGTEGKTTEELLDRYYESRSIDKGEERKYAKQIRDATEASKRAFSAEEAIRLLEPLQKYLQFNTKVGGNAYFELAQALDANEKEDEATEIYQQLASSPHADIRRKSREVLSKETRPKRVYKTNVWNLFWDKWD